MELRWGFYFLCCDFKDARSGVVEPLLPSWMRESDIVTDGCGMVLCAIAKFDFEMTKYLDIESGTYGKGTTKHKGRRAPQL